MSAPTNNNSITLPATIVFQQTWEAVLSKEFKLIVQEGSSRSSKTWSDFQVIYLYSWSFPLKVINILRDTATDCRDIVETEWVRWLSDPMGRTKQLEDGLITITQFDAYIKREALTRFFIENKTKHTWTLRHNKSTIRFTGLDDDDKVMGMTQHVCWINEPYKFPHEVYKQLAQRTSDFILLDWNPKLKLWVEQEKKKSTTKVLRSTFRDNPFCPEQSRNQILSYQPLSMVNAALAVLEKDRKERIDMLRVYDVVANPAQFNAFDLEEITRARYNESTGSASEYHWSVYGLGIGAELPNRIFRWKSIPLHEYHAIDVPRYYYSDWGAVDPWAVGEVKYNDGCLYIRELNYQSENQLRGNMNATELMQVSGAEEGLVTLRFNQMGIEKNRDILCDPNRPLKILALREAGWEYALAAPKPKGSIIDGIDLLNNLKVFFTEDSENIDYEQQNYSRKVDRYGVVLEEPEDINNHHMDGARYAATFLQNEGVIQKI